jgi:hypothetical protein
MNLLQRINEVRKGIDYIQKDKSVSTGGGSYRAVTHDTVTAMVRAHMVEHGIVVWPFLVDSQSMPKEEGSKQFRYQATYDFTFANIDEARDQIIIRIEAHAMDNADKAPGKALSYAAKYALLKVFNIETGEDEESRFGGEGLDDAEFSTLLDGIHSAADMKALQAAFKTAFKAADEAKDKDAQKMLIKAKDARKVALAGVAA